MLLIPARIRQIKQDGYDMGAKDGLKIGREEGYGAGYGEGLRRGREEGRNEGFREGRTEGIRRGRKDGRKEGREEGRIEGVKQGREEGRIDLSRFVQAALWSAYVDANGVVALRLTPELERFLAGEDVQLPPPPPPPAPPPQPFRRHSRLARKRRRG